ncbi:MAG: DUF2147 domain-containing protein [Raineya sp.]
MKKISLLLSLAFIFISSSLFAQDEIVGIWMNDEGTARVQIYKTSEGKYNGRIVWLKEPNDPDTGKPKLDKKNPNENMRNKPVRGLVNLVGLVHKGNKKWGDGTIYDPKNGNTYTCNAELKGDNTLNLKGVIPGTGIGRTAVWSRQTKK